MEVLIYIPITVMVMVFVGMVFVALKRRQSENKKIVYTSKLNIPMLQIRDLIDNVHQFGVKDTWCFFVRHMGGDIIKNKKPLQLEGVEYNNYEKPPHCVFSFSRDNWSSHIDTSILPYREPAGTHPHTVMSYQFENPPIVFDENKKPLLFSAELCISKFDSVFGPVSDSLPPVVQLGMIPYFEDSNGNRFAMVLNVFDNRIGYPKLAVRNDTRVAYCSSPVFNTAYISITPKSHVSTNIPHSYLRLYEVYLTEENLRNIITELNEYGFQDKQFDTDPSKYRCISFGVLHETSLRGLPSNVTISTTKGRNPKVSRMS